MDWTPYQIAELTKLWGEGLSTSEIGKRMGIGKNAVIGKAHRLDLDSRPSPIKRKDWTPLTPEERKARRRARWQRQRAQTTVVPIRRQDLMTWTNMPLSISQTCQHIAGDPKEDPSKCGKPAVEGKPYCPDHCAACYIVHQPKAERQAA